jgi:hypothetical protein
MKVILMQVRDTATQLPSESGSTAWVWIILIAVVAVVGYFIWKGRQLPPPIVPPTDTPRSSASDQHTKPKNK